MAREPAVIADRYELREVLGRGGMGEVRRAHDRRLARDVAVKILDASSGAKPENLARFEYEAKAAGALVHANVVRVYDFGDDGDRLYLVMEVLSGRTLVDEMALGPLLPERVVQVAQDVLAGLGAAHAHGIVHRDIKPGNVLFDDADRAKVSDFGVATSGTHDLTQTGLVVGTPAYVAPERLQGAAATPRSDIYAVGVMCYEALAGVKPFTGDSPIAVALAIERAQPTPLHERRPDVPRPLCDVVARAMAHDPSARFATAEDFARALGAALAGDDRSAVTAMLVESTPEPAIAATQAVPRAEARTRALPAVPPADATLTPAAPRRAGRNRAATVAMVLVLVALVVAAAVVGYLAFSDDGGSDQERRPLQTPELEDAFDHLQDLIEP
jgi:serine/threonine protein kinase